MARTALTLAAVAMLSFAAPQAGGAGQSGPAPAPPAAPPEPAPAQKTGEGAGTKTEADDKPKPAETAPSPGAQSPAPPSDGDSQSTLAALIGRIRGPHHGLRSGRGGDTPIGQGLLRRHRRDPAKGGRFRRLLLYAEGLCEWETEYDSRLYRSPLGRTPSSFAQPGMREKNTLSQ